MFSYNELTPVEMRPALNRNEYGRYTISEEIGRGGMGYVYRAVDRLTGQTVALKSISAPFEDRGDDQLPHNEGLELLRLSLAQEFRLLAGLRHPNVISVLDYGFDAIQRPYLVLELLPSARTINEAAQNLSIEGRTTLLIQTLQALSYLHHRGIIHRDVKPGNLLVTPNDQVKVLDFGLSIVHDGMTDRDQAIAGTLTYIAPETLSDSTVSHVSDLYSLGVIAYELFTGSHPFEDGDLSSLIEAIIYQQPDLSRIEAPEKLISVIGKLLEKAPEKRFQQADEAIAAFCTAANLPLPTESHTLREGLLQTARFTGRTQELESLKAELQQAKNGQGAVWLVGGESGVGKSRLVDELRIQALVSGFTVLRGQAVEDGGLPYHAWRSTLRELIVTTSITKQQASVLKLLVPDIEALTGQTVPDASVMDGRAAQQRLARTIVGLLRSHSRPLLLILEDFQWGDESLELLKEVIRSIHDLPILIAVTYRDDERPDLASQLPNAKLLSLKRLDEGEVAALAASMLGQKQAHPEVVQLLTQETEGNVFFIVEVMRLLAEDAGKLSDVGTYTLPAHVFGGGMERVVERRLARVPEEAQQLLKYAAVAGRLLDLRVLAQLAPDTDLENWLTDCVNASVIERLDGQWRFAHDKLREYQLKRISDDERATLYSRVARAVEAVYPDTSQHNETLTRLWHQAGDEEREAHYALRAGEQAIRTGIYRQARVFYERALEIHGKLSSFDPLTLAQTNLRLGEIYYGLGEYSRAREYLSNNTEACIDKNREDGFSAICARALNILGNIALAFGEHDDAQRQLESSVDLSKAAGLQLEMGKSLRSLGVIAETLGDSAKAQQLYLDSLEIFKSVEDDLGVAGALANLAAVAVHNENLPLARERYEFALERFETIEFQWGIAYTLTNLALVLVELGEIDTAQQYHLRALNICSEIGHKWGAALSQSNLAAAYLAAGDRAAAGNHLREALRTALEIQTRPLALDIFFLYARWLLPSDAARAAAIFKTIADHPQSEPNTSKKSRALLETLPPAEGLTFEAVAEEILR